MSVSQIIEALLEKRGIPQSEQAHFLHPDFDRDLHDASVMKDMPAALTRLQTALGKQERVVIFGDYDADGVPATALLTRVLRSFGFHIIPLIPSRVHGYGLTAESLDIILSYTPSLVIAVDNGTVAQEEVSKLKSLGVDVIIIDHHDPHGELATDALAIINPKQPGCAYPFKELCACGLAWKVVREFALLEGKDTAALKWELDLVALSTIADMVPLVDENRLLVFYGLKVLQKTRNKGLKALMQAAGIEPAQIRAGDVGFKIAPRINAPSRMHNEQVDGENCALEIFISSDDAKLARLAAYLSRQNSERQGLVESHVAEAERQAADLSQDLILVVHHESWSTGVIGLVASRLVEKYKRPVIALASEDRVIKGSVRSVDGVHALDLLASVADSLERFGGHAKAAGLTLKASPELLRKGVNEYAMKQAYTIVTLRVAAERQPDCAITLAEASLELAEAIEQLEPFGIGFPRPLFQSICLIENARAVGSSGQHLSCFLEDGTAQKKAIAFQRGGLEIDPGQKYHVCYTLEKETWREVTSSVCHIQAILNEDMLDNQ